MGKHEDYSGVADIVSNQMCRLPSYLVKVPSAALVCGGRENFRRLH